MREQIIKILINLLKCNKLEIGDDDLFEEQGIDSLVKVELAIELESTFNIEISSENIEKLTSIRTTMEVINNIVGGDNNEVCS